MRNMSNNIKNKQKYNALNYRKVIYCVLTLIRAHRIKNIVLSDFLYQLNNNFQMHSQSISTVNFIMGI